MNNAPDAPVKIILDTDFAMDCDDVGALCVLHALADMGEARILAIGACDKNAWIPPAIDAINTYYGRPEIPVGVPRNEAPLSASVFTRTIADHCPHKLTSADQAEDAVQLYRRILEQQDDQSVTFVSIGYLTNLANLLRVPAEGERLSGAELVQRKVKQWVCMGGNFLGNPVHDDLSKGNFNFTKDPVAAHYTVAHWPAPVMFAGRQMCSSYSGLTAGLRLAEVPEDHPARIAYECYYGGKPGARHVADLVTVLFAVRGLRDYWDAHTTGHMDLKPDMTFDWIEDGSKRQGYLLKKIVDGQPNDRYVERICEELMIQPPARRGTPL